MTNELSTHAEPLRPLDPLERGFAPNLQEFVDDALLPRVSKLLEDSERRTEQKIDELTASYDRQLKQKSEVSDIMIGSFDKHLREAERTLISATTDLKDELKESRARAETLNRVTIRLENTLERVDKDNTQQEASINNLKEASHDTDLRLRMLENTVSILQKSQANTVEMLTGNPAEPGIIAQIKQNNETLEAIKAQLVELNRPKGLARLADWLKRNPAAVLLLMLAINLLVVAKV